MTQKHIDIIRKYFPSLTFYKLIELEVEEITIFVLKKGEESQRLVLPQNIKIF